MSTWLYFGLFDHMAKLVGYERASMEEYKQENSLINEMGRRLNWGCQRWWTLKGYEVRMRYKRACFNFSCFGFLLCYCNWLSLSMTAYYFFLLFLFLFRCAQFHFSSMLKWISLVRVPRTGPVAYVMLRSSSKCIFLKIGLSWTARGLIQFIQTVMLKRRRILAVDLIAVQRYMRGLGSGLNGVNAVRCCETRTFDIPSWRWYTVKKNTADRHD